jgi:hypothetical protein
LQEVQAHQTKNAGGKEVVFEVDDKLWLSMWHFWMTRPSMTFEYKWPRLYAVSRVINKNGYKLYHPYMIWKDNMFHFSLLDRYTPPTATRQPSELQLTFLQDCDDREVDRIHDSTSRF